MELLSTIRCFDGQQLRYRHHSSVNNCEMTFSIFLPAETENGVKVPVLYWLSGLTCTDENFMQKAGVQRIAAELGVAIVAPDTSPRGEAVADDENGAYDLGLGAGFYLNATEAPWARHYQMYDYVVTELPALITAHFPVTAKKSISGHSMGGHGAITIALKNSESYQSVSAFSPIANPSNCPWGQKAFHAYLGAAPKNWQHYDACYLINNRPLSAQGDEHKGLPLLVDQGLADNFLAEQLGFDTLQKTVEQNHYPATLRAQTGYDHSYYFIATFIEDHVRFHAQYLKQD